MACIVTSSASAPVGTPDQKHTLCCCCWLQVIWLIVVAFFFAKVRLGANCSCTTKLHRSDRTSLPASCSPPASPSHIFCCCSSFPLAAACTSHADFSPLSPPLVQGIEKTGLGARVANLFVKALGTSTLGLSMGLNIAECLLAPAMPSSSARAGGIFVPIIKSLSESAGSQPGRERQGG